MASGLGGSNGVNECLICSEIFMAFFFVFSSPFSCRFLFLFLVWDKAVLEMVEIGLPILQTLCIQAYAKELSVIGAPYDAGEAMR